MNFWDELVGIVLIAVVFFWFHKIPFVQTTQLTKSILRLAFGFRILCAVAITTVYTFIYPIRSEADTFKFYDDSKLIYEEFKHHPSEVILLLLPFRETHNTQEKAITEQLNVWNRANDDGLWNDNRIIIKLNGWIHFFSFGNYYIHVIVFNIIAFIGLLALYKAFIRIQFNKHMSYWILFFLPSLTFWSAGVMKDGVLLFGLGLFLLGLTEKELRKKIPLLTIGILILSSIKIYILACALPIICAILIQHYTSLKTALTYLLVFSVTALGILLENRINGNTSIIQLALNKQSEFIRYTNTYSFGSSFYIAPIKQVTDLFLAIPTGLLNSLFQPLPWLIKSPLHVIGLIENVLIFLIIITTCSIRSFKHMSISKRHALLFSLSILILLGMSTPNFGALIRYRVVALPFLILPFIDDSKTRALRLKISKKVNKVIR